MESKPGVFAVAQSQDGWEPDPEVGGEMRVLCELEGVHAGMSRLRAGSGSDLLDAAGAGDDPRPRRRGREVEIDGAEPITLRPGDMASMPAGSRTTWHLNTPFREFWVLAG